MHSSSCFPKWRSAAFAVLALAAVALPGAPTRAEEKADGALDKALTEIPAYDFGQSWAAFTTVEDELRTAANRFAATEERLIAVLESPEATYAAKQRICKILRSWGTVRCVPALAKLLGDEELSHMARFGLQEMEAPEAGAALRNALPNLQGDLAIGVIGSLGVRRDAEAIPALAKLAACKDCDATVKAALNALGKIGTADAASVLAKAQTAPALALALDEARVACAERMLEEGKSPAALVTFRDIFIAGHSTPVRAAALHGVVQVEGVKTLPVLLGLLKGEEGDLSDAALMFIAGIPGEETTQELARQLPTLAPGQQLAFLQALAARADKSAAPAVAKATASENEAVRLLAIQTLGSLGSASDVAPLASLAAAKDATGTAAIGALERLSAQGVDEAIANTIRDGKDPAARAGLIQTLVARQAFGATGLLLTTARDANGDVRRESLKALGDLAGKQDLQEMTAVLASATDSEDIKVGELALVAACKRAAPEAERAGYALKALEGAPSAGRASLLRVLGKLGGKEAYEAVSACVKESDAEIRDAAIRSLAGWPDQTAMPLLLGLASGAETEIHRIQALRGYIRLLGLPCDRPIDKTLEMYNAAKQHATRPDEKQMLIATATGVEDAKILAFLKGFLDDESVKVEAGTAIQKVSTALGETVKHVALGRPVELQFPFGANYPGGGPNGLTDGYLANESASHARWQGFEGDDLVATIDLGAEIAVNEVRVGFFEDLGPWVFLPKSISFALSKDGKEFETLSTIEVPQPAEMRAAARHDFAGDLGGKTGRFLRVYAASVGKCPKWHSGGGSKVWMFADEIQVNPEFVK